MVKWIDGIFSIKINIDNEIVVKLLIFFSFIEFVICHPLIFELKIVIYDGRILESNYVETN